LLTEFREENFIKCPQFANRIQRRKLYKRSTIYKQNSKKETLWKAYNLQTEFREENFIQEYHDTPSRIHKITEELQCVLSLQHKDLNLIKVFIYTFLKII
jgi:hypothetical protein